MPFAVGREQYVFHTLLRHINVILSLKFSGLGLKLQQMHWILGRKLELSIYNKLLIYSNILKPIWTYGISLWGTASNSNIEMLQRYKNKILRAKVNALWYVFNKVLHKDLKEPTIREEITKFSVKYRDKITTHTNELTSTLLEEE